eukprot:scaffold83988_cov28-Tisochrysis_lutea.AAC.8
MLAAGFGRRASAEAEAPAERADPAGAVVKLGAVTEAAKAAFSRSAFLSCRRSIATCTPGERRLGARAGIAVLAPATGAAGGGWVGRTGAWAVRRPVSPVPPPSRLLPRSPSHQRPARPPLAGSASRPAEGGVPSSSDHQVSARGGRVAREAGAARLHVLLRGERNLMRRRCRSEGRGGWARANEEHAQLGGARAIPPTAGSLSANLCRPVRAFPRYRDARTFSSAARTSSSSNSSARTRRVYGVARAAGVAPAAMQGNARRPARARRQQQRDCTRPPWTMPPAVPPSAAGAAPRCRARAARSVGAAAASVLGHMERRRGGGEVEVGPRRRQPQQLVPRANTVPRPVCRLPHAPYATLTLHPILVHPSLQRAADLPCMHRASLASTPCAPPPFSSLSLGL